jgi:flagellar basal-body rod protein FlgF
MDAAGYVTLTRQSGLMTEMQLIANNIANSATTGFRREGIVFAEHVRRLEDSPSLSMAHASARHVDLSQAGLEQTGGSFDFAIQGEGFFLIETGAGQRLTRSGSYTPSASGELVTPDGARLLDLGGAPVVVPTGARLVALAPDGTLSADGAGITRIGLWRPVDPLTLTHQAGTLFSAETVEPAEGGTLHQGFLESSNVNPVSEIARMITVQRAYELGQTFLDQENGRIRSVIEALGR